MATRCMCNSNNNLVLKILRTICFIAIVSDISLFIYNKDRIKDVFIESVEYFTKWGLW